MSGIQYFSISVSLCSRLQWCAVCSFLWVSAFVLGARGMQHVMTYSFARMCTSSCCPACGRIFSVNFQPVIRMVRSGNLLVPVSSFSSTTTLVASKILPAAVVVHNTFALEARLQNSVRRYTSDDAVVQPSAWVSSREWKQFQNVPIFICMLRVIYRSRTSQSFPV